MVGLHGRIPDPPAIVIGRRDRARAVNRVMLALLVALGGAAAAAEPPADPCKGMTTLDMEACLAKKVQAAQSTLATFTAEVRRLLPAKSADRNAFEQSQTAWTRFVALDCKAVYQHWIDGSIRGIQASGCRLTHLEHRVCNLWWTYLQLAVTTVKDPNCPLTDAP
jgi:uncharacterized protein YecT (DUF1311 family)